ncbi:MAG: discoidin domain-containing protein, partial [Armatimonadetes bacterium]|nr:discoidin domain-containing protein [Armatimonadota bacterium]
NFLGITSDGRTPLRLRVQTEASRRQEEFRQLIGNRPNVAAGARAFVSSANQPDSSAPQLTDGRFGEDNQVVGLPGGCFVVDLGRPQTVAALLWSRDRLCELNYNGITDYEIEVSDDGQQWKPVLQVRGNREVWGRFDKFEPVTARFVRLQVRTSSYEPVVDEVEVYGVAR